MDDVFLILSVKMEVVLQPTFGVVGGREIEKEEVYEYVPGCKGTDVFLDGKE